MVTTVHPSTDLARRLEAFVIERFPFAVAPARAAFDVCKSAVKLDEASLDALRPKFAQELRTRLQNIAPIDRTETTPGIEAPARFQTAIDELLDACDGFLRRAAIRVSLTPRPGGDRREEVYAACELLQALGLRAFAPSVTACPGCGRTTSTTFQELAERTQDYIRAQMPEWKKRYEGVETLTLAVMGCVVNGPGESKAANIGISLPGTGEAPNCPVFIDGEHFTTLRGTYDELAEGFRTLVDNYVATRYSARS